MQYCRQRCDPRITQEAATYLSREYVDIREQVTRVDILILCVCARLREVHSPNSCHIGIKCLLAVVAQLQALPCQDHTHC